jgi:uncharacterized protein
MDFILASNNSQYQIESFNLGSITINQQSYKQSVLVSAHALTLWRPQSLAEININDLELFAPLQADVILLGVGTHMHFLKPELQAFIQQHRLPLEVMTTAAACRTFHVLTSEQRLVYAALLMAD